VRPLPAAAIGLIAAVLGGVSVLAVGKSAGWLDPRSETVVVRAEAPTQDAAAPAAVRSKAKPLPGNTFDPARIYAARAAGVVTVYSFFEYSRDQAASPGGQGSGFVVSRDGYVLTNAHVITNAGSSDSGEVAPAERVFVQFSDGDRVPVRIVGWDVFDDVGVLKVDPKAHALTPLPLGDSSRVVVGEPVAAIGSPFGNEGSLSVGVVAATRRSISALTAPGYRLIDAIQTDAPINRGNSGGPLFDARGRVIGINAQIRSTSGTAEGVGFAVPINAAKRSLAQLIESGRVAYAYVGVVTDSLTPRLARHYGYRTSYGAVIVEVNSGTPAARAGLRPGRNAEPLNGIGFVRGGDVIVAINGQPVRSADDVVRVVAERLRPHQVATFTIVRGSRRLTVPVKLGERPPNPDAGR
jgi:2-alkenal reductase